MRPSGSPGRGSAGGVAAGAAAFAAVLWLAAGGTSTLRSLVESPETGIRRALAAPLQSGPPRAVGGAGAAVRFDRVRFTDLIVTSRGSGAEVVAVADAEGAVAWRGQDVRVSYVGRERFSMVRCRPEGWCVEGERVPRLSALLSVLARRADAFAEADAEGYRALVADDYLGPEGGKAGLLRRLAADLGGSPRARLRPLGWQVRIDRETAQVGEDFEIALDAGAPRRLRARFDLRDDGGHWRFTGGL